MNYYDLVASDNPQATQKQINERLITQNNLLTQQNLKLENLEKQLSKQSLYNEKQAKKSNSINTWVLVLSVISTITGIISCIIALINP